MLLDFFKGRSDPVHSFLFLASAISPLLRAGLEETQLFISTYTISVSSLWSNDLQPECGPSLKRHSYHTDVHPFVAPTSEVVPWRQWDLKLNLKLW